MLHDVLYSVVYIFLHSFVLHNLSFSLITYTNSDKVHHAIGDQFI